MAVIEKSVKAGVQKRLSAEVEKPVKADDGVGALLIDVDPEKVRRMEMGYRQLRSAGLNAEREELFRLTRRGVISDEISRRLIRNTSP